MSRISTLRRRDTRDMISVTAMRRHREKVPFCKPRRSILTESADTLTLDFPAFRPIRNKLVLFKTQSL